MTKFNSPYIYFSCQHGAESTLKPELCGEGSPYRLAYSQKGFVTLKTELSIPPWSKALPESPLIRSRGHVLGQFNGDNSNQLIDEIFAKIDGLDWQALHVWQRDIAQPGWHGFEPGRSALAEMIAEQIRARLTTSGDSRSHSINKIVPAETKLVEIIVDDPNRWWVGARTVQSTEDGWPGGVYAIASPENMISRAYLKITEAIAWSGIPFKAGDRVVEIGSSPGGACQRLLDLGLMVTGVDPADMDPIIADHPRFEHWRSRSLQVKRKLFKPFRYLVCDANVAPNYTLDTVEAIVSYPTSRIKGMLLTIKLSSWEHAQYIPEHIERVRSWGFNEVRARQLSHNRREYCLYAFRNVDKPTTDS